MWLKIKEIYAEKKKRSHSTIDIKKVIINNEPEEEIDSYIVLDLSSLSN